jgi:hypothetical protein
MKTIASFIITLFIATASFSQEYKVAKSSGRLDISEVNNVTVEGHAGNEIIFSSLDGSREKDERAQGLRAVSGNGLEDNTGIGLSVVDKGNVIEVRQLKRMDGPKVKILIPKGVTLYFRHTSPHGHDLKLRNVESEIEISTVHQGIHLQNVTGPLNIRSVHGEIEADFDANVKGPLTLSSTHGLVDIAIPTALKANVFLSTSHGEIFVDPALKLEFPKEGEWVKYGSNKIDGKLNGGGLELSLATGHSNIYLRKK